ncbi:MAG: carbohydrate ABC transporter permease [Fimbriimonas sp.]|nr:carbohydrate ABC transporter permease [Fimbriimonas sp.]
MRSLGPQLTRWTTQFVMACGAVLMAAPLVWMLETSFKPEGEVMSSTPHWLPGHPTLENYLSLFSPDHLEEFPVVRWFLNSVGISLVATLLVLAVASMAAYAFARLKFRYREPLFFLVLSTMMVPGQVMLIPVFLIVQKLGLFNTYPGIVLPGLGGAFGVFLLRQFFLQLPVELEEAAFLDGAGYFTIFSRIIVPLSKPALAALAIFTFMASWNDFVWPLIVTDDVAMRTLPVGLTIFQGRYTLQYGLTMAAAAVTTLPMIIAFLIFQKRITEGIALQGLKG